MASEDAREHTIREILDQSEAREEFTDKLWDALGEDGFTNVVLEDDTARDELLEKLSEDIRHQRDCCSIDVLESKIDLSKSITDLNRIIAGKYSCNDTCDPCFQFDERLICASEQGKLNSKHAQLTITALLKDPVFQKELGQNIKTAVRASLSSTTRSAAGLKRKSPSTNAQMAPGVVPSAPSHALHEANSTKLNLQVVDLTADDGSQAQSHKQVKTS